MPRLYLDTVANAEADIVQGQTRISRGFAVAGIDTTNAAEALLRGLSIGGMPARGSMLSPNYPTWTLRRYAVRALRNKILTGRLVYEEPLLGTPDETFAAEDTTTLASGTTQFVPGTMEPLRVVFGGTLTIADLAAGETVTLSEPDSLRNIVLSGLFSTPPDIALQAAHKSVNAETWMGLPRGYWWYSGIRVTWDNSSRKYRVTITVTTKTEQDWSSYGATRNPADGKYAQVPQNELNTLATQQYERGVRYQKYGLMKAGLKRLVNFHNLFGTIVDRLP